jgi:6-phosphofructokinase 1
VARRASGEAGRDRISAAFRRPSGRAGRSDTALDTALEPIGRLRVTASSHTRAFIVEVMGRNCGYLALMAGVTGGAESIVLPEEPTDPEQLAAEIRKSYARRKSHALIIVAEGARYNADACATFASTPGGWVSS